MEDIDLEYAEALLKDTNFSKEKTNIEVTHSDHNNQATIESPIDLHKKSNENEEENNERSRSRKKEKKSKKDKSKKKKKDKKKKKEKEESEMKEEGKSTSRQKKSKKEKKEKEKKKKRSRTRSKDKKRDSVSPVKKRVSSSKSQPRNERIQKSVSKKDSRRKRTRSISRENRKEKETEKKGKNEHFKRENAHQEPKRQNENRNERMSKDTKPSNSYKRPYNEEGREVKRDQQYNPRFDPQYYQISFEDTLEDKQKFELQVLESSLLDAQKNADETKRDDCTILVLYLPVRATEMEIYGYFKKCGKIRDIKIIKDPKTELSKGISYIEFYNHEGVLKAMSMSGQDIEGHTIKVMPSGAEKNRAAAAAKHSKVSQSKPIIELPGTTPQFNPSAPSMKIYIMGLTESLSTLGELDLRDLFSPFGDIDSIELPKDPVNNKNIGFAIIQYRHAGDARAAINKMNGLTMRNKTIAVSAYCNIPGVVDHSVNENELDEEIFIRTSQSRNMLMQKLMREPGISTQAVQTAITPKTEPSSVLLLTDMFSSNDIRSKDTSFFTDLRDEVSDLCKKYGKVEKVIVDIQSDGYVWIKFSDVDAAKKAHHFLGQRTIHGKKLASFYIPESQFYLRFENES